MMYRLIIIDADSSAVDRIVQSMDWLSLGFEMAATFSSGKDALPYMRLESVDAVLLSAERSGDEAMDVAMFVHKNLPNCQVVLMSDFLDYSFMKRAMQCGICDHILKPVELDILRNTLETLRKTLDQSKCRAIRHARENREQTTSKLRSKRSSSAALIRHATKYIDQNLLEGVSLGAVSEYLHISASHLIRIFKNETGHTFLEYVTNKKMEKAAELLAKENLKVYEVSTMLGYRSTRYFSKLFFKRFGCYPSEYAEILTEH